MIGPVIVLQKMPILAKKSLFRWKSFWSWRICKKAKLLHLGHRKPARIHCKADAPKTSHCLVRILVQRLNPAIFLRKWTKRGRYTRWRSLPSHVERIFVHNYWRGGYWQHLVSTVRRYVPHSRSYTRCFPLCFWISHYQSQSWCRLVACNLTPLDYYLWAAVKDKCYADKPETIDTLKDKLFEWNYFPLVTGGIALSNKKRNLRKYSVVFLKHFLKKRYLADPIYNFFFFLQINFYFKHFQNFWCILIVYRKIGPCLPKEK